MDQDADQSCLMQLKVMYDADQSCLIQLKALYEMIDFNSLSYEFIKQRLMPLIEYWNGQLPNIRDIFSTGEVDLLLNKCIDDDISPRSLVDFLIRADYKDEPPVDEDGKPLLRRTTPLHYLLEWGEEKEEKIKELIRELFKIYHRFDVNHVEEGTSVTHFHVALSHGLYDLVEKFRELGPDPLLNGNPPLHWAMEERNMEAFEWLLRNGADPNSVNEEKSTLLHLFCKNKSITSRHWAKMLFEICEKIGRTVQVNARDRAGNTPLHLAMPCAPKNFIVWLLEQGADPTATNATGLNPQHFIFIREDDDKDSVRKLFEICHEKDEEMQVDA